MTLRLSQPVETVLHELAKRKIQGGFALNQAYPELGNCLLVCVTETKNSEDIKQFAKLLRDVLEGRKVA
jgi:glycine dehydrogenase subunit 1